MATGKITQIEGRIGGRFANWLRRLAWRLLEWDLPADVTQGGVTHRITGGLEIKITPQNRCLWVESGEGTVCLDLSKRAHARYQTPWGWVYVATEGSQEDSYA